MVIRKVAKSIRGGDRSFKKKKKEKKRNEKKRKSASVQSIFREVERKCTDQIVFHSYFALLDFFESSFLKKEEKKIARTTVNYVEIAVFTVRLKES